MVRGAAIAPLRLAFKLTLKRNVKIIAHGSALRHNPDPTETWEGNTAYGRLKPAAQKMVNKVFATFNERRMLSGHLFWDTRAWHFFYFDNHDQDTHRNHWAGGPHIHLTNHLWPNRSATAVWDEFRKGNPVMKGALHIRFERDRK